MRIKTDAKRKAILMTARATFLELGYHATTMSELSARLGGARATLYSYFSSKQDILCAVLEDFVAQHARDSFQILQKHNQPYIDTLREFADCFVIAVGGSDAVNLRRQAVAVAVNSAVAKRFLAIGPARTIEEVTRFIERGIKDGEFAADDPKLAAKQLLALLGGPSSLQLEGAVKLSKRQAQRYAQAAVDIFLRSYAG